MSKIIYYIGAGASYGRKEAREVLEEGTENEHLIVHEGLPIVNEITRSLLTFKKAIERASIDNEHYYVFKNNSPYQIKGANVNRHEQNSSEILKIYIKHPLSMPRLTLMLRSSFWQGVMKTLND